jgi:hypothetical protein
MQVILSKPILGFYKNDDGIYTSRKHAEEGDTLDVIIKNKTHFICDSLVFPETAVAVFPSQCSEIIIEKEKIDEHSEERYYNVYEEPIILKNDIFDPDELEY